MLLQAFYSIRSERVLMERLDLLFRWFVGIGATIQPGTIGVLEEPRPAA
jgi:hypothetical protein